VPGSKAASFVETPASTATSSPASASSSGQAGGSGGHRRSHNHNNSNKRTLSRNSSGSGSSSGSTQGMAPTTAVSTTVSTTTLARQTRPVKRGARELRADSFPQVQKALVRQATALVRKMRTRLLSNEEVADFDALILLGNQSALEVAREGLLALQAQLDDNFGETTTDQDQEADQEFGQQESVAERRNAREEEGVGERGGEEDEEGGAERGAVDTPTVPLVVPEDVEGSASVSTPSQPGAGTGEEPRQPPPPPPPLGCEEEPSKTPLTTDLVPFSSGLGAGAVGGSSSSSSSIAHESSCREEEEGTL